MDTSREIIRDTDNSGADSAGPVSSSTMTIGGEDFSVDPRNGTLNYSFTFFTGNVNYGQTPFTLAMQYQQNAAASYVGAFTDDDKHAHPFGVSAYLATPEPKAMEDDSSDVDDAGGVWDLNLPSITISTSKVSTFYGKDKIAATVSLGDVSYQYLLDIPSTDQEHYVKDYTKAFLRATSDSDHKSVPPLYSVDGRFLSVFSGPGDDQIVVQDKYGTNYLFTASVLYGYKGVNTYDPTYNSSNNADADQLLLYKITNIFYANGQTLNFTYEDHWHNPQQHTLTIGDTIGNIIARLKWDDTTETIQIANQQGVLVTTHQLTSYPGDFRIKTIENLISGRKISFKYLVNQAVPYDWQNQTALAQILNEYTGYTTEMKYQQFNSNHAYDAGCNKFSLAEIAVLTVENFDDQHKSLSKSTYDFGFSHTTAPNFVLPQDSDKKSYASGLNHWLDNLFYDNKDSDGCSSSERVDAASQTYGSTIQTTYPDTARNREQSFTYDALGRTISEEVRATDGPSKGKCLAKTDYSFEKTPYELRSGSYTDLPYSYGSPILTNSRVNLASMNGIVLDDDSQYFLSLPQRYSYNDFGNPSKEISPLGQITEYTYVSADDTFPANERLVKSVKTHSIGDDGASYKLETQSFQAFQIAPTDGGIFMPKVVLPVKNVETHYDATTKTTYSYRTDTMGGYIGGNNYNDSDQNLVAINGYLTQRGQEDDTGVSDVTSTEITYFPNITTLGSQRVLSLSSSISGSTTKGILTTQKRGGGCINFMGYPLQQLNALGQISTQTYDDLGRLTSMITLANTTSAQTTSYAYDLDEDLQLDQVNARFSRRMIDSYGNITVQLFDARQRHISTYQTLNGSKRVQTADYTYDSANNIRGETILGNGYRIVQTHYYSPGTAVLIATVGNFGLAKGHILDSLNGVSLAFSYTPDPSAPTTIKEIFGPVQIRRSNNTSQLVEVTGLIDADAASQALKGLDLVTLSTNNNVPVKLQTLAGNPWAPTGLVPYPLLDLYEAITVLPQENGPDGCQLMEYKIYGYDSWHRHVRTTHQTFINSGTVDNATPTFSETETIREYKTAERTLVFTYPEGQLKSCTYNLMNGLQDSSLSVNGVTTRLGSLEHDGLGRILAYKDSLNGSYSSATYTGAGLISSRTDPYGNTTTYTYDHVTFKLTQSKLTPAGSGESIEVMREYDNHLQPISAVDEQGNGYQWAYADSGLVLSQSLTLAEVNQLLPYQATYRYDDYGDLIHVADPFLPYPLKTEKSCVMVQNNLSSHGFDIHRDEFGRISQLIAGSFHGVNRNFNYNSVTGLLASEVLGNLPSMFGCGDTGSLSLTTTFGYDQNLRAISKDVSRSDVFTTAHFSQIYDMSNRVAGRGRVDFQGLVLNEIFSYDVQTGFLTGYANDAGSGGTAAPSTYLSSIAGIGVAEYSYDLYGNLTQAIFEGTGTAMLRRYSYPTPGSTTANPFQLLSIEEQDFEGFENIVTRTGSFSYDIAGNTVADAYGRAYTYDAHGLIHSIQRADQQTEVFTRDGLGRTIKRTAPWLDGPIHDFGLAQFHQSKQLWQTEFFAGTASYACAPGGVVPVEEQPAFVSIDDLARQSIHTISYGAHLGFQLMGATSYLPYGTATDLSQLDSGYPANLQNTADYPASVMGMAIGADTGTGLRVLGDYRTYDPVLGRFLQWDSMSPFGMGGLNGYAYAGNDPVNFWDPSGHYSSVKARRYGPKPLESHHTNHGSFWQGFLAGFKHGVKSFFMSPYNYAKNFGEDLAHGRWVGALELGFDLAVDSYIQESTGLIGTMALQEFVTLSPSNIFSGKSPVKSACGGSPNRYQMGYRLGGFAGSVADSAVLAVAFAVVGSYLAEADASVAIDSDVANDATNSSRLQISERTPARDEAGVAADGGGSDGPQGDEPRSAESSRSESVSKTRRVMRSIKGGVNKIRSLVWRKLILPHDPQDPFPWQEGLRVGQRIGGVVTVTGEAFSQARTFVAHLASWGGSTTPNGKHTIWKDPTGHATANDHSPSDAPKGLDPSQKSKATKPMPYTPPEPPPLDLPGS